MKKIVIYQEWGGLGDNLAHTTIPRLCKKYGYECYLSKHNKFRNNETYELLFKDLPLIDEKNDTWRDNTRIYKTTEWNHIRSIQLGYGFTEAPYSYPFINYKPKYIKELKNATLVDLSSIHLFKYNSNILTPENVKRIYNKILELGNIDKIHQLYKNNYTNYKEMIVTDKKYKIDSLFDYCDALYSCKNFITICSGQSNLASTIKNQFHNNTKLNIYTISLQKHLPPINYDSYFFRNTNYIALDNGTLYKATQHKG